MNISLATQIYQDFSKLNTQEQLKFIQGLPLKEQHTLRKVLEFASHKILEPPSVEELEELQKAKKVSTIDKFLGKGVNPHQLIREFEKAHHLETAEKKLKQWNLGAKTDLLKAAELGNAHAYYHLALIETEKFVAEKYLKMGAEGGDAFCQLELVKRNLNNAEIAQDWLSKALAQKPDFQREFEPYVPVILNLGKQYEKYNLWAQAFKLYQQVNFPEEMKRIEAHLKPQEYEDLLRHGSQRDQFKLANRLIDQGKIGEAAELLLKIAKTGFGPNLEAALEKVRGSADKATAARIEKELKRQRPHQYSHSVIYDARSYAYSVPHVFNKNRGKSALNRGIEYLKESGIDIDKDRGQQLAKLLSQVNVEKALESFVYAIENGNPRAAYYFVVIKNSQNPNYSSKVTLTLLEKGAKAGDPLCQMELGKYLLKAKNPLEAKKWALKAAEQLKNNEELRRLTKEVSQAIRKLKG